MTFIKRYKHQNTKGIKGVIKILRTDIANLKWRVQYTWKKYIEYPLRGLK